MQKEVNGKNLATLYNVIQQLRGPGGCPWDIKQTPETLKKYLLEETEELAEAITDCAHRHICEEIGDLFFILLLYVRIYEEEGYFSLSDVLSAITEKMIRRHPHVFAGMDTGSDSELKKQWETIKAEEKKKR